MWENIVKAVHYVVNVKKINPEGISPLSSLLSSVLSLSSPSSLYSL
jgi:hypothetical protein